MGHWSIKFRLQLLLGFLAMALLVVGGLGLFAMHSAEDDFESIYSHQVLPLRGVDRIRRLVLENSSQVFRAIQHNPSYEYAKLHDHPVDQHLDVIEKNVDAMNDTFRSLESDLIAGSPEAALLPDIEKKYQNYLEIVLKPATSSLRAGDFSWQVVSKFLAANRAFEKEFNDEMKHLVETQQHSVQEKFEAAKARNQSIRSMALVSITLGLLLGIVLGVKIIRSILAPLDAMRDVMVAAANKDFTRQVTVAQEDEVGQTAQAFNLLMQNLRGMLSGLRQDMVKIDDATANLATAAQQASVASGESSGAASAMAASVEEMSVSISSVSDNTRDALDVARTAGKDSETGGVVIADAVHEMEAIAVQVRNVGSTITVLGDHSHKISSVVQVIKDVADQTNLLALNAAIEAARAGEAGRGFAVVADEVRKLAERTTLATGEIADMINAIQSSSQLAVTSMDATISRLQKGSELAASAGVAIESIRTSNHHVLEVVRDINEAMIEQGAASQDIAQRVERVAQASEQSSASVLISASAAQEIHRLSMEMRTEVDRFQV